LKEAEDKITDEDKEPVEDKLTELEELIIEDGNPKEIEDIDPAEIQAKVKELEEAMHAISAKLYEAASAQMESEEAAEEASADGNDVVDADFEVVDEEEN
jgi:molecular chaperone DnaK